MPYFNDEDIGVFVAGMALNDVCLPMDRTERFVCLRESDAVVLDRWSNTKTPTVQYCTAELLAWACHRSKLIQLDKGTKLCKLTDSDLDEWTEFLREYVQLSE